MQPRRAGLRAGRVGGGGARGPGAAVLAAAAAGDAGAHGGRLTFALYARPGVRHVHNHTGSGFWINGRTAHGVAAGHRGRDAGDRLRRVPQAVPRLHPAVADDRLRVLRPRQLRTADPLPAQTRRRSGLRGVDRHRCDRHRDLRHDLPRRRGLHPEARLHRLRDRGHHRPAAVGLGALGSFFRIRSARVSGALRPSRAGAGACRCKAQEGVDAARRRPTTTPQMCVPGSATPTRSGRQALVARTRW
ncbi:hypothetical protein SGPA1_11898 [Streptomyces misionensis JCM 4497]